VAKLWKRITRALFGAKSRRVTVAASPRRSVQPPRRTRARASFENSQTEQRILHVLAVQEPLTVTMVRTLLPDCMTVNQALPQMWKRGVVVRRREAGRNAYWYARSADAFTKVLPSAITFTDRDRMRHAGWGTVVLQPVEDGDE
jgi:hypothetical protein